MTRRRLGFWVSAAVLLTGLAIAPESAIAAGTSGPPPGTPVAQSTLGDRTVAAVFRNGVGAGHECTASVVESPYDDILVSAAHCFSGTVAGVQVAPGYHDGVAPYGVWTITAAYADPQWIDHGDTRRDWVFLVAAPRVVNGRTVHIEDVVGGNVPWFALRPGQPVSVPAYPAGIDDRQITCATGTYSTNGYPAFDCDGYVGGTSGAPWLVSTRLGHAVGGVIGGLHQGGCVSWTSYTSPMGQAAWRAYLRAAIGAPPDTLPVAGSDGC